MSDYYCDFSIVNGDTNGAGTFDDPWQTVTKCLTVADGGDTVWIGDGGAQVLTAEISWGGAKTTSGSLPIIFRGWEYLAGAQAPGIGDIDGNDAVSGLFSATNRPSWCIFQSLKLHATTSLIMSSEAFWVFYDCEIYDSSAGGIGGSPIYTCVISSHVHDCDTTAVSLSSSGVVLNSYVHNCNVALYLPGAGSTAIFNVFHTCASTMIMVSGDAAFVLLNTFDRTSQVSGTPSAIDIYAGKEFAVILGNIFTHHGTDSGSGAAIDHVAGSTCMLTGHNHFFGNTVNDGGTPVKFIDLGNDKDGDPGYANRAAGDYTPSASVAEMGWPREWLGLSMHTYIDVGAVQRREDWVQRRTTIDEDLYVDTVAEGEVLLPSAGSFSNAHFASDANIATDKMLHKHTVSFGQSGVVEDESIQIHLVSGATGTIIRFSAGAISAPTTGSMTVDLEKDGVSILSEAIPIAIGVANRVLIPAVISSAALVDGDWLDVVIVKGASDASGVYAQLEVDETAPEVV